MGFAFIPEITVLGFIAGFLGSLLFVGCDIELDTDTGRVSRQFRILGYSVVDPDWFSVDDIAELSVRRNGQTFLCSLEARLKNGMSVPLRLRHHPLPTVMGEEEAVELKEFARRLARMAGIAVTVANTALEQIDAEGSGESISSCEICSKPITADRAVHCSTCGTRFHEYCWKENGGCNVPGCVECLGNLVPVRVNSAAFLAVTSRGLVPWRFILGIPALFWIVACILTAIYGWRLGLPILSPPEAACLLTLHFLLVCIHGAQIVTSRLTFDSVAGVVYRQLLLDGYAVLGARVPWFRFRDVKAFILVDSHNVFLRRVNKELTAVLKSGEKCSLMSWLMPVYEQDYDHDHVLARRIVDFIGRDLDAGFLPAPMEGRAADKEKGEQLPALSVSGDTFSILEPSQPYRDHSAIQILAACIVPPVVGLVALGVTVAISGRPWPPFDDCAGMASLLTFFSVAAFVLPYVISRHELSFNPAEGIVTRRLKLAGLFAMGPTDEGWLRADNIVGLELETRQSSPFVLIEDLYANLEDGSRRKLMTLAKAIDTFSRKEALDRVRRIARFADCAVHSIPQ